MLQSLTGIIHFFLMDYIYCYYNVYLRIYNSHLKKTKFYPEYILHRNVACIFPFTFTSRTWMHFSTTACWLSFNISIIHRYSKKQRRIHSNCHFFFTWLIWPNMVCVITIFLLRGEIPPLPKLNQSLAGKRKCWGSRCWEQLINSFSFFIK